MRPSRILVVDDDANLLLLLRHNLESQGYQVVAASDGAEGLRLALEGHFDFFLIDVMLPHLSGLELCREIRSEPRHADTPLFLVTARAQMSDYEDASDHGASGYVTKPFDPLQLMKLVADHLAQRSEPA